MADLSNRILESIRDEMVLTREALTTRIDATNQRMDRMNERLEGVEHQLQRVAQRQTASEIRLASEIVSVVGAIGDLKSAILEDRQLRHAVSDHEARIRALESA